MASDFLLEIDGIKGESQDDKHKETIEVSSFSWGHTNAGSMGSGGGGGAGKVSFNDLSFTAVSHKGSPLLAQSCATGKHISKAVLYVRKQGGAQEDFYTITLTDVLVSSFQSGGHEGQSVPYEQYTLNFAKIEWKYAPQDAKGAVGSPVVFKYDLKANK
jgi:type VI secretion system secreted protein Hcp